MSQEDANGCGLATLAMICGRTYQEIKGKVDPEGTHDWAQHGVSHYALDRYLAVDGWWMQRRYESWGMPLVPFAPIHYASVEQPSRRNHFVCVLGDGTVLDPLREGKFSLADWSKVNQLVGLIHP